MKNEIKLFSLMLLFTLVISTAFSYQFLMQRSGMVIIELSGKVTKDNGDPISGAKVEIVEPPSCYYQGGNIYTYTKSDGTYSGITAQYYCTNLPTKFKFKATYGTKISTKTYTVYDGNNPLNVNFILDYTPPKITFNPNSNSWTRSTTVIIYATDTVSKVTNVWYKIISYGSSCGVTGYTKVNGDSVTISLSNSGQWEICAYGEDSANNIGSPVVSGVYKIDTKAPTTTITPNSHDWTNKDVKVTISASDTLSGVNKLYYKIISSTSSCGSTGYSSISGTQKTITISNNGQWEICTYAVDKAGNKGPIHISGVYKIDKEKPSLTITPNTTCTTGPVKLTFKLSDSYSGLKKLDVYLDNALTKTFNYNGQNSYTQIYSLNIPTHNTQIKGTVYDRVGNSNSKTVTINFDNQGPNAPTITSYKEYTKPGQIDIIKWNPVSDVGCAGLDHYIVRIVSSGSTKTYTTTSTSYKFKPQKNGQYIISVAGVDKLGNVGHYSSTIYIIADDEAPVFLSLTSNAVKYNGNFYVKSGANVKFTAEVQDRYSGVSKCFAHIGSAKYSASVHQDSYTTYTCTYSRVINSNTDLYFSALDKLNNQGVSNTISVIVDDIKPTVDVTAKKYWNTTPLLPYTFSDNVVLKHIVIAVDGTPIINENVNKQTVSGTFNMGGVAEGTHTVIFQATDLVLNKETKTYNICYDTQEPKINSVQVTYSGTSVNFVWSAADNGCAGIDHYILKVDGKEVYNGQDTHYSGTFNGGVHTWILTAVDKAGNTYSKSGSFNSDNTPPIVKLILPTEYWNNESVKFKFKAIDDFSSKMSCKIYIDGTFLKEVTVNNNTEESFVEMLWEGNHNWKVECTDNAGNIGKSSANFIVDITPPTTTDNAPSNWVNHTFTLILTAHDNYGVDGTYYSIDGGIWKRYTGGVSISTDGVHVIKYYSIDRAGNVESKKSATVKIDTKAPTTTITPNSHDWTNKDVKVTISASDTLSGVNKLYYKIISSTSSCGSTGYSSISGTQKTITISNNGQWEICTYAVDKAGNKGPIHISGVYKIDKEKPSLTITPKSHDWTNKDIIVTISSSSLSGINETGYKVVQYLDDCGTSGYTTSNSNTITVKLNKTGTWKVCAYAKDNAGNVINNESGAYYIDKEKPTLTISAPAQNSYISNNNVKITWNADDTPSGIAYYNVSINGGAWLKLTDTEYQTTLSDGNYLVKVRAIDNAGNYIEKNVSFTIDTTKPTITITSPSDGSVHTGNSITISWNANDQNMDKFEVYVNGNLVTTLDATANSYTLTNLNDGKYDVKVIAVDKAGNDNVDEVSFTMDNHSPNVNFLGPTDWTTENFNIKFNVSDIQSKVECNVTFDGNKIYSEKTMGVVSIPMSNILGGNHNLKIICDDGINPVTEVDKVIKVDNTTPTIISISPSGSIETGGFVVTVNATDTLSGVDKVVADFKGNEYVMQKVDGVYQVNLYNTLTGTFNVVVKVYDKAGHVTSDSTVLSFYKKSSGGGSFSGGTTTGGSCTVNGYKCETNSDCCSGYCNAGICTNTPLDVKLGVNVQPELQTIFDKDSAKFTFIVSNSGKDLARNIKISVEGINGTLSASEITLAAGTDKAIYFMTKLPAGEYNGKVIVKFENQTVEKGFKLTVLSYAKHEEQQYAKDMCANASMHIVDLASKGMNVTKLYSEYDNAVQLMSAGNYSAAGKICNGIMNTTAKPNAPTISPFFIAVAKGIKANAVYLGLSITLITAVMIWLKRRAIWTYFQMRKLR